MDIQSAATAPRAMKRVVAILALTIAAAAALGGCATPNASTGAQVTGDGAGTRDQVSPRRERLPIR